MKIKTKVKAGQGCRSWIDCPEGTFCDFRDMTCQPFTELPTVSTSAPMVTIITPGNQT